jgi:hypothetical protein
MITRRHDRVYASLGATRLHTSTRSGPFLRYDRLRATIPGTNFAERLFYDVGCKRSTRRVSLKTTNYSEATWLQPSRVAGGAWQTSPFSCDPHPKVEGAYHDREGHHRSHEPHDIRAEAHP